MLRYFLATFLIFSPHLFACSCVPDGPDIQKEVQDSLGQAGAVFVGKVVNSVTFTNSDGEEVQTVTFEVKEAFKGASGLSFQTETTVTCCICGFTFELSETYIVYTYINSNGVHSVSFCSRSKPIAYSIDDLAILRKLSR